MLKTMFKKRPSAERVKVPFQNLKVLYGTGAIKLTDDNEVVRAGRVKYTIKDGIVYDARALLADVKRMVDEAKDQQQYEIYQPGKFRQKPE